MAEVPIPTTKRATSKNIREVDRALRIEPRVKTRIPNKRVLLLPNKSPSFPRMGAHAAVDMACARADHVVLF